MSDYWVYMRVENRFDLLRKAVDSIKEFWPLLTIVDNSPDGIQKEWEWPCVIFRPPVPLTFTQSHNYFFKDARSKGARFILWMHTDAEAVDDGHLKLLELARQYTAEGRKWGLIWTNYDSLSAVNLDMIEDVGGYDTEFSKYYCDCDLIRRMKLLDWETIDSPIYTEHIGSQTIKSNQIWEFINTQTFDLYRQYYVKKHGGDIGHETFEHPFDQPWMSWKDAHPQA